MSGGTSGGVAGLRAQVRTFLRAARDAGEFEARCDSWLVGHSPAFSRALGERGWLGMTWPARYGGHERSAVERLAIVEELLVAGAPVAAHWIADRQSGPQILRHGSEAMRLRILPRIAAGTCFFALGLSEPGSGSDLASVRTRARKSGTGWTLSGQKVWTSGAHHVHYITVLGRTSGAPDDRHAGLSLFVVDLATPGITVRPIRLLSGEHHFNEVFLDDVEIGEDALLGAEGQGWQLITSELSLERSGPERYLSTFVVLDELVRSLHGAADPIARRLVGELMAELWTLRRMSVAIARQLDDGADPVVEAAAFKDLGTRFESRVLQVVRQVRPCVPDRASADRLEALLAEGILAAPGFTLRGGTNEILRSIVAKGAGVR